MSEETIYKAQERSLMSRDRSRLAVVMIGGGLGLLALTLSGINMLALLAPMIFVSGAGLLLTWPSYRAIEDQPARAPWLAAPGFLMMTIGVLVFIMGLFDRPEMMAYLWPLFIISFVGGMMYGYRYRDDHPIHRTGPKILNVLGWITVGAALFFELLVYEALGPWWPLVIVAFGLYQLIMRGRTQNQKM